MNILANRNAHQTISGRQVYQDWSCKADVSVLEK